MGLSRWRLPRLFVAIPWPHNPMIKIMLWEVSKQPFHKHKGKGTRLSVAYRALLRNVHASACPEVLSLTNDRKASKFKGISLCIALNSFERKSPPLVIRGVWTQNTPPCGVLIASLDKLTDRLNRLSVFCLWWKTFQQKALIVLFILVYILFRAILASKINNLQQ